jgi:hypothetical protein
MRMHGTKYAARAVLLDHDRFPQLSADAQAELHRLAASSGIRLIWQRPCHEAVLLRHLDGCHDRRPQNTSAAKRALEMEWPFYRDEVSGPALFRRITLEQIRRACAVEQELREFLIAIGLL